VAITLTKGSFAKKLHSFAYIGHWLTAVSFLCTCLFVSLHIYIGVRVSADRLLIFQNILQDMPSLHAQESGSGFLDDDGVLRTAEDSSEKVE